LPIDEAVQTFVDVANLRGGPDNISIVAAKVIGNGVPEGAPLDNNGNGHADAFNDQPPAIGSALLLLAAGAAMGVLAYCLVNQYWAGAVAASVALVGLLVATMVSRPQAVTHSMPIRSIGGPYGNGPYRKASAAPSREVVDALVAVAEVVKTLADTESKDWSIDWQVYQASRDEAAKAADANDYVAAIRHCCHAIRNVMQQIRDHRRSLAP
jgi:protein phosphatase